MQVVMLRLLIVLGFGLWFTPQAFAAEQRCNRYRYQSRKRDIQSLESQQEWSSPLKRKRPLFQFQP